MMSTEFQDFVAGCNKYRRRFPGFRLTSGDLAESSLDQCRGARLPFRGALIQPWRLRLAAAKA